jgi:hypothetical protein
VTGSIRKCSIFATILLMLTSTTAANAAAYPGVRLTDSAFREQNLPQNRDIRAIALVQDYEDGRAKFFAIDVNGDGVRDFIIRSNDSLCGTGGCGYVLVDGKTFTTLGEFTGVEPIISDSKVNGHALVIFIKYSAADRADLEVWAFNKKKYAYSKVIKLKGKDLAHQVKLFSVIE